MKYRKKLSLYVMTMFSMFGCMVVPNVLAVDIQPKTPFIEAY